MRRGAAFQAIWVNIARTAIFAACKKNPRTNCDHSRPTKETWKGFASSAEGREGRGIYMEGLGKKQWGDSRAARVKSGMFPLRPDGVDRPVRELPRGLGETWRKCSVGRERDLNQRLRQSERAASKRKAALKRKKNWAPNTSTVVGIKKKVTAGKSLSRGREEGGTRPRSSHPLQSARRARKQKPAKRSVGTEESWEDGDNATGGATTSIRHLAKDRICCTRGWLGDDVAIPIVVLSKK